MTCDGFYELFIDTGDPLFWLMSRRESGGAADAGRTAPAADTEKTPADGRPQAVL